MTKVAVGGIGKRVVKWVHSRGQSSMKDMLSFIFSTVDDWMTDE
jgi:hypothetical protein